MVYSSARKTIIAAMLLCILLSIQYGVFSEPIHITDAAHREVVLQGVPGRVVSLSPSITEILVALGLRDNIVGVDSYSYNDTYMDICNYFRSRNVVDVGGYWWSAVNVEKIIALDTDVVLADLGAHYKLLDVFEENNITIIYLHGGSASSIEDIYLDIDLVGRIFNVSKEKVDELINNISKNISRARAELADYIGTKALVVVGFWNGIWVAGKGTFIDSLLQYIGLDNAVETSGWSIVSIEEVASWDPDIIIVTNMGYVDNETLRKTGLLSLGKPIRILTLSETNLITRPGPRIGEAAEVIVNIIQATIQPKRLQYIVKTLTSTRTEKQIVTETHMLTTTETYLTTINKINGVFQTQYYWLVAGFSIILAVVVLYISRRR